MRTWGRVPVGTIVNYSSAIGRFVIALSPIGGSVQTDYMWVAVTTDANGNNDAVYLTTLAQVLKLNLGESPIYGNYGIPAQASVQSQTPPDYYAMLTQQYFTPFFTALQIARETTTMSLDPIYNVTVVAQPGAILMNPVPE